MGRGAVVPANDITVSWRERKLNETRGSFQVGVVTPNEAEIGTNVEYALYVNDGHVQHRRFLPISYLSAGGRGKYIQPGNTKGIMLKEKYIPGKHFLENGMRQAEPRLKTIGESFMQQIGREIEGGG